MQRNKRFSRETFSSSPPHLWHNLDVRNSSTSIKSTPFASKCLLILLIGPLFWFFKKREKRKKFIKHLIKNEVKEIKILPFWLANSRLYKSLPCQQMSHETCWPFYWRRRSSWCPSQISLVAGNSQTIESGTFASFISQFVKQPRQHWFESFKQSQSTQITQFVEK